MTRKWKDYSIISLLLLIALLTGLTSSYFFYKISVDNLPDKPVEKVAVKIFPTLSPTPTMYEYPYKNPPISKNRSYRIVIVGDSIIKSLGANANVLREYLIKLYPDSEFVTYNYGYPSTNIESLPARLTEKTKSGELEFDPILKQGFELIIIESFGYNPLSESSLEGGLKKQEDVLEKSLSLIFSEKPNVALAFLTPIAPDPVNFAKGTLDLSPEQRRSWVEERISYIENFKKFASKKGIPVIDVYKMSLNPDGSVNRIYISNDFIHPSPQGINLISRAIADYIYQNKVFPQ